MNVNIKIITISLIICCLFFSTKTAAMNGNSGFGYCSTNIHKIIPFRNSNLKMIVFERECGATVPYNTQIGILKGNGLFSPNQNNTFFVVSGKYKLDARWNNNKEIEVFVPKNVEVYKKERTIMGINILYK